MKSSCSKCGAQAAPEARFCRHCGTPLKPVSTLNESVPVSPLAQTVPLSSEGHTTSGLGADDSGRAVSETKRVRRDEMENLLRHSRFPVEPDGDDDGHDGTRISSADYAAPPTGELGRDDRPRAAASPTARAAYARPSGNRRRAWALMSISLLLATLCGALIAYYFLRSRTPESATGMTAQSNGNQAAEAADINAAAGQTSERPAQPEETQRPSPTPVSSVDAQREARAAQERERGAAGEPARTPAAAPSATPPAQTTPAPSPSPPAANGSESTATLEASSSAFYFQAINVINGRDPRALKRAELLRALQLFQNVKAGPHVAEARKQAARLGRELDRLGKQ